MTDLAMSYSYSPDKQVLSEQPRRLVGVLDRSEATWGIAPKAREAGLSQTFAPGGVLSATGFTAQYDPGNRIVSYQRSGGVSPPDQTWNYDDNGNWSSTTQAGNTTARNFNATNDEQPRRLVGVLDRSEATWGTAPKAREAGLSQPSNGTQYDARGNMTRDNEGQEYIYDLDNRIARIEPTSGPVIELQYDALGRRVHHQQGITETAFLWWGDQEVSEHKNQAGQATIQNDLWAHPGALNTIIARAYEGSKFEIQWYHKNYLDHVYGVSDDTGTLLEFYRYSAFGEPEVYSPTGQQLVSTAIENDVLWNSRRYDISTKLYYYKYRHYHPKLGRWPSRDPIQERGGVNLYKFCYNSPANYIDIKGETPWHVAVAAVVAVSYGSYKAGESVGNFIVDVVDSFEEVEEVEEANEAFKDFAGDPCEKTLNNLEKKRRGAAGAIQDATVSGANVAGTGMQGAPPTVPTRTADVVADTVNTIIGETIGK